MDKPARPCTSLVFGDAEEVQQMGVEPMVTKVKHGQEADPHHHSDGAPGEEEGEQSQQPHKGAAGFPGFDQPTTASCC